MHNHNTEVHIVYTYSLVYKLYIFIIIASFPPTGLTANSTQTTIFLTWAEPNTPNGVITHYDVSHT